MASGECSEALELISQGKDFRIIGGAGSGKTELMKDIIAALLSRDARCRIACISYTNAAVDNLNARLPSGVDVSTIHSFASKQIFRFRASLKECLKEIFQLSNDDLNLREHYVRMLGEKADETLFTVSQNREQDLAYANAEIVRIIEENCIANEIRTHESRYDDFQSFSIGYDSILKIFNIMMRKYPLFSKILRDTYGIILIDEYQDTNQDILKNLIANFSDDRHVIGIFGDPMQAIYMQKDIDCSNFIDVPKLDNYRCSEPVIELMNKLRPDFPQKLAKIDGQNDSDRAGVVKVFYDIARSGAGNQLDDLIGKYKEGRLLALTNRAIAHQSGYGNFFEAFRELGEDAMQRADDAMDYMQWRDAAELVGLYRDGKIHQLIERLLTLGNYKIDKVDKKNKLDQTFSQITSDANINIGDLMQRLFNEQILIEKNIRRERKKALEQLHVENERMKHYKLLRDEDIQWSEIMNYVDHSDDQLSPSSTLHGTKGSSIDNVTVVMDNYGWRKYDFHKLIELDINSDDRVYQDTRKLFYVACSRARYNLTCLMLLKDEREALTLKKFFEGFQVEMTT